MQQEEEEEARRMTCLDFGAERHKLLKGTRANFCDKCDRFESLEHQQKTEKRRHTKTYWCTVKGHVLNIPSKTNKGYLNTHYSLDRNSNDDKVIHSLVPPNISEKQQLTASPARSASNILHPQTPDSLHAPAATNKTQSNDTNLQTPE
jgi:hypothetical protein